MPNIGMIDSRIRNVIEINIKVRKDSKGFHLFFYDFQTKEFLRKVFLPKWKVERVFKLDLYDTYSFVRSVPLPNNEKQAK
ncbi:hypothetical protein, partial [Klebsiella pneumoniae]|uniref:hypothetical protein n=1 Tax=Klebsiella pneumoniae TaxID=573 RepID=UPI0019680750